MIPDNFASYNILAKTLQQEDILPSQMMEVDSL
jgi:hypothetical protein